ncbi:M48 family metallopeptidase [Nodularia sphaerocarpa]|uniref:M48 family metallopeptidase n=1 Tax=Nodularia sphaerocarpa TaxID=137816 RepID=UPI001EFB8F29|nr:M48 family metallopeptidase [Nodularia sphaerocarpa]MDB9372498.1 M48 family metalloprotease [Nodularia sphaerocarpa CS-585]MDB9380137.1 M48 family metalloprotease [Nodularia sphaerocarpa CS-585A2]ULP71282.1 Protease HtpX [Nodularia sphaerocarpa UHCC 0038]
MHSDGELSLEAGLVALKQGNYQTAIAKLTPVASSQENTTANLQARVGLVMAYARVGQIRKASALCQLLTQSQNTQVKEWAELALTHLTKRKKSSKDSNTAPKHKPQDTAAETTSVHNSSGVKSVSLGNPVIPSVGYQNRMMNADAPVSISGSFFGSSSQTKTPSSSIYWRQGKRAKVWQPLRKPNLIPLRLLAVGTFAALFWVMREVINLVTGFINFALVKLPYLNPLQFLYRNPTPFLLIVLFIIIGLSPWLLDWLLADFYGQRELSKDVLHNHSRETARVLQRYCQQRRWQSPKLRILPVAAPIALSYGNLSRNARIVVSQGLLEQLADDEIATIYATQLGHIAHWDFVVMSLVLLLTLPIHRLYQQISIWGNKKSEGIWYKPITILASVIYGLWCLLTGISLWLSRLRLYYSDRLASEITGNPNALTRALLKIAIGIAVDIQKSEQTNWHLSSLNLFIPVGYEQSLSLGSIAGQQPFETLLMWDTIYPYRRWFTINNSHPLIGDRIQRLSQIARHWHIDPELHLTSPGLSVAEVQPTYQVKRQSFLLQIAPFLAIPLGAVFAGLIWLTWQTAFTLRLINLKWIYEDWSFVTGCLLIGFSIGMVLRMNSFFPDIKNATVQNDHSLPNLLTNPSAIPIDSISVRLSGKLLGRRGTANCLGQDLILQSSTGLVKLHHLPLGQSVNPQDLIGRQIIVTGWFRRGATPWIDIHTVQTQSGKTIQSPHPIWSTVVAVAAQAWGAYIFLTG